jgi:hypothetical protein
MDLLESDEEVGMLDSFREIAEEIGQDNHDVRQSARTRPETTMSGFTFGSAPPMPDAPPTTKNTGMGSGIDLHDEKNVASLEDAGLMQHMAQARLRYRVSAAKSESVDRSISRTSQAFSQLMLNVKTQQMAMQIAVDNIILQATNVERIMKHTQPHGYPKLTDSVEEWYDSCFPILKCRLQAIGDDATQMLTMLNTFESDLTITRTKFAELVSSLERE